MTDLPEHVKQAVREAVGKAYQEKLAPSSGYVARMVAGELDDMVYMQMAFLGAEAALRAVQGWRPIESAKKDGTRMWLINSQMKEPVIGTWGDYCSPFSGVKQKEWIVTHDVCERYTPMPYGQLVCPTLWMPLPAAPAAGGDDE
ncbi:MAG: hypothetical protein ACAH27_06045 [Xanthobacteraceae bacterium]